MALQQQGMALQGKGDALFTQMSKLWHSIPYNQAAVPQEYPYSRVCLYIQIKSWNQDEIANKNSFNTYCLEQPSIAPVWLLNTSIFYK